MNTNPLVTKVEEITKTNPVVVFMKGTAQFPQCGFSARACQVLKASGVNDFTTIDVLSDDPLWDALEAFTQWPTVPQIFIGGEFIGGCDIISEMYERGDLATLLKDKKVTA
ncbi:MAG TPA: Grx4 family monothiol glutaredoxin [Oligoflexia bacterium]|nr:Grx4 family monothiol glutaredoxin [Oligoflexia bacterium]